jgi:hypothetical protein
VCFHLIFFFFLPFKEISIIIFLKILIRFILIETEMVKNVIPVSMRNPMLHRKPNFRLYQFVLAFLIHLLIYKIRLVCIFFNFFFKPKIKVISFFFLFLSDLSLSHSLSSLSQSMLWKILVRKTDRSPSLISLYRDSVSCDFKR